MVDVTDSLDLEPIGLFVERRCDRFRFDRVDDSPLAESNVLRLRRDVLLADSARVGAEVSLTERADRVVRVLR